jgi:hypothetical protein
VGFVGIVQEDDEVVINLPLELFKKLLHGFGWFKSYCILKRLTYEYYTWR